MSIRYWVISPNVKNDGNSDYWLQRSELEKRVFIGYDYNHQIGKRFFDQIKIGDIIIIAQGAKDNRILYLCGIVKSDIKYDEGSDAHFKEVEYYLDSSAFLIQGVVIDSTNAAGYSANPTALYELKRNHIPDLKVIDKIYLIIKEKMQVHKISEIKEILSYKMQIIVQGPPGTGKTRLAKLLAKQIVKETLLIDDRTIKSLLSVGLKIPSSTEYTEYTILDIGVLNITLELKDLKSQYKPSFIEIINAFNIKMWDGKQVKDNDPYAAAIAKYVYDHLPDTNISLIQFHPSFTYEDFVRGISVDINNNLPEYIVKNRILVEMAEKALDNPSLNFVLIIDEINRANLPAVLGELIYALEYRYDPDNPKDTTVESLYGIKNKDTSTLNRELRLPKNLFIIGTMNTADRSVGHIDYAIRRRFAFVDILPNPEPVHPDVKSIFATVSELFIKDLGEYIQTVKLERSECLASDFRPEDVWLGHSYFICKDKDEKDLPSLEAKSILLNKIKYEVIPILKEYIKDGILLDYDKTKAAIQSLSNWS